jgi:hypothetical protein
MNSIISTVQSKLNLLREFQQHSADFLLEIQGGDLNGLQQFERKRAQCIEAILIRENQISEIAKVISENMKTSEFRASLAELKRLCEVHLTEIQQLDAKIFDKLGQEKDQLRALLFDFNRSEKLVRKFKSTWVRPSGEKLDGSL